HLQSPVVLSRTLDLLEAAATQEEQIFCAKALAQIEDGWSPSDRRRMLNWLQHGLRFRGGRIVEQSVRAIRDAVILQLSENDRVQLADLLTAVNETISPTELDVERPVIQRWTVDDFADNSGSDHQSNRANGRMALAAVRCLKCHRVGDEGGRDGPDLTQVGKRFDRRMILESILDPSRVIDPKYRQTTYALKSGEIVIGRALQVSRSKLVIETNAMTGASLEISRDAIDESAPSSVSLMPAGLVDSLTQQEILDLISYLQNPEGL
ncbi:MAG: c-type cytochrome, partial [Planctomycetaceae bacterium]|nr:c-type cytochrome [Planctomycetaceae bacterium]